MHHETISNESTQQDHAPEESGSSHFDTVTNGDSVGKSRTELIDPTMEDAYWRNNHPYQIYSQGRPFEEFCSAYRAGYEAYFEYSSTGSFEVVEDRIRQRYEQNEPKLMWQEARPASRAAWQKFEAIKV
jgi:hypothetical protein